MSFQDFPKRKNSSQDVRTVALLVHNGNKIPDMDAFTSLKNTIHNLSLYLEAFQRFSESVVKLYTVFDSYYPQYVSFRAEYLKNNQVRSSLPQTKEFVDALAGLMEYYVYTDAKKFLGLSQSILKDVKSLEALASKVIEVYSIPYDSVLKKRAVDIDNTFRMSLSKEKRTQAVQGSKSSAIQYLEDRNAKCTFSALNEFMGPIDKSNKECIVGISEAAYNVLILCQHLKLLLDPKNTIGQEEKYRSFEIESHHNLLNGQARNIMTQCEKYQGVIPLLEGRLKRFEVNDASHVSVLKKMLDEKKAEESERTSQRMNTFPANISRPASNFCISSLFPWNWSGAWNSYPRESEADQAASPRDSHAVCAQHERLLILINAVYAVCMYLMITLWYWL